MDHYSSAHPLLGSTHNVQSTLPIHTDCSSLPSDSASDDTTRYLEDLVRMSRRHLTTRDQEDRHRVFERSPARNGQGRERTSRQSPSRNRERHINAKRTPKQSQMRLNNASRRVGHENGGNGSLYHARIERARLDKIRNIKIRKGNRNISKNVPPRIVPPNAEITNAETSNIEVPDRAKGRCYCGALQKRFYYGPPNISFATRNPKDYYVLCSVTRKSISDCIQTI